MEETVYMEMFEKCDILIHKNDIEYRGYDKYYTLVDMLKLAYENKCPIIVKNGKNGKWYLKGKNYNYTDLKNQIKKNKGKSRNGVKCWIVKFKKNI